MLRREDEGDIVLSTRIRLARNISGLHFISKMTVSERKILEEQLRSVVENSSFFNDYAVYSTEDLDELDRIVLKEKKIISERFYRSGSGLIAIRGDQQTSLVCGDLDHIRISTLSHGLALQRALPSTLAVERELAVNYDFVRSDRQGFLTASISDAGTAMKGSVYLHLPVLSASDDLDHLIIDTIGTKLEVTGFSGGGSQSLGGFYIISNRSGEAGEEKELADLLEDTARRFAQREREAREDVLSGDNPVLEDRIFRSYGLLRYCRQISELEAFSALSMVRLGAALELFEDISLDDFPSVFQSIGNGFLRSFAYESNPDENDIMRLRARTIRKGLKIGL